VPYLDCFSGVSAAKSDLSGLFIPGISLKEADLENSTFDWSAVHTANFDEANLANSTFVGSDLDNASFLLTNVEGCEFSANQFRTRSLLRESRGNYSIDVFNLVNIDPTDLDWLISDQGAADRRRIQIGDNVSPWRDTSWDDQWTALQSFLSQVQVVTID
jgi:uncharacterized protein YjbI with pentapeptide repeats